MEEKLAFSKVLEQMHESAQRLPIETAAVAAAPVVVEDPLRPGYSMLVHPDGHVQFKPSLSLVRYKIVADIIQQFITCGFTLKKVVDLGCSDKSFLMHGLLKMPAIREVVCLDQCLSKLVEEKQLFQADHDRRALSLHVQLIEANILDIPRPISRPQVVTLIEVIEHFQVADLPRLLWIVFSLMQPRVFIITTPNSDFNLTYPVPGGKRFRHYDHKFEWNKIEFERFCEGVTKIYPNYSVVFDGCGYGASGHYCTQIAVFCVTSFCLLLKGKLVETRGGSTVEKILTLNDERCKAPAAEKVSTTAIGPGCEACPVPFSSADEHGSELYENERNVNLVLSELHSLAKQRMRSAENKGDSIMSEPENLPTKREQKETMSPIVETEVVERNGDANKLDASLLKLSFKNPSDQSASLLTPESPSTSTVHDQGLPVLLNRIEHFTDKYRTVQDITYENVETLFANALLQETGRFVWCCNSNNIYYPFTDKIEKFKGGWNYLNILQSTEGNRPVKKRLLLPFTEMSTVSYKARKLMPRYTDENDGACCEEHKTYKIFCSKCPFVYIKKKVVPKGEDPPKMHTKHWYQDFVVYENSSATKLWFSFTLLKHYLGINDEKVLRKAFSQTDNYTPVEIKDKRHTFHYYCCVIGEEKKEDLDDDDDDDDDDDEDDEEDSCPPSAGYSGSQDSLRSNLDESSMSTPPPSPAPPSPAPPSQGGGNRARGESVDSLDLMETREASPLEEKHQSSGSVMASRTLDSRLSRAAEEAGSRAIGTVPNRPAAVSNVEWTVAHATAGAFSVTTNADRSVLTSAILCALVTLADMRAACANAEPADRHHAFDFHGSSDGAIALSGLHTLQLGSHDKITAVDGASCVLPLTCETSLEKHLKAVKHSSLLEVNRASRRAHTSGALLAASSVTARFRSSVAASSSARGPLAAASFATANPTSNVSRVSSFARGGSKVLTKSQPNVSSLGGVRASYTVALALPKESIATSAASRTASIVTRTTSAPRTTSSATRPLVASAARSTFNASRTTASSAESVARATKSASQRLSQPFSFRGADSAPREARPPVAVPVPSASKTSLRSRKVVSDKTSA